MAQGKDFCLECNSCTERVTQDGEQGNQGRHHRPRSLSRSRAKCNRSATIEFLVGTAVEGLNNNIRVVTRRSYGFRTYEAMEIALYHTLGHSSCNDKGRNTSEGFPKLGCVIKSHETRN